MRKCRGWRGVNGSTLRHRGESLRAAEYHQSGPAGAPTPGTPACAAPFAPVTRSGAAREMVARVAFTAVFDLVALQQGVWIGTTIRREPGWRSRRLLPKSATFGIRMATKLPFVATPAATRRRLLSAFGLHSSAWSRLDAAHHRTVRVGVPLRPDYARVAATQDNPNSWRRSWCFCHRRLVCRHGR
jgi:hypothetical protein